jgi:CheY-like chemotaxis protein
MSNDASSLPRKKVLIVDSNPESNTGLKDWFDTQPDFELVGVFLLPQQALGIAETVSPEIALVGIDLPNGIKFCKVLRKKNPAMCIIALIPELNAEMQFALRQSGAIETLVRGSPPDLIGQTIQSVTAIEGSTLCSIVGISGIKEGVGTTFLTSLLGVYLGKHLPDRVLVMDLDFRRGDLAFSLGEKTKKHIQDLVAMGDFLHTKHLQNFIVRTPRRVSLLPAAQEAGLKIISDIAFVGLLTTLGNFFEVILVDLPPYPCPGLAGVLDICDTIIINAGETSNQMKSTWQLFHTDLKKMAPSSAEKILFTSWRRDPEGMAELEALTPRCAFLPKPQACAFSDPSFSIHHSVEFAPLRTALGVLLGKMPGLSLYSNLEEASASDGSSFSTSLARLRQFFWGE